jgi:hypothetical protein
MDYNEGIEKESMKKWLIPVWVINGSKEQAESGFIGFAPFHRKGYLCLYSKNTMKNYYFKNPKPLSTHFAYVAERGSCPSYFSKVINPYDHQTNNL